MSDHHQSTYSHLHLPDLGRFPEADVLAVSVETVAPKTWVTAALQCYKFGALSQAALRQNWCCLQKLSRLSIATQKVLTRDPLQAQSHCEQAPRASNPTDAATDFRQETERLCRHYCFFPSYTQISAQAGREHPEIRMGNGGAGDVQAAGRASCLLKVSPQTRRRACSSKTQEQPLCPETCLHEQNELNSGYQQVYLY